MELMLAAVVVAAVIFFGALISAGNERQRKAIDDLRAQTVLWALQDLRIKRERLAQSASIDNPVSWFNRIAAKVYGYDLKLQFVEGFDEPRGLLFTSDDNVRKIVFSPLSQTEINRLRTLKRSRLSQFSSQNPLLSLPRSIKPYELSVLNCGILFDLELSLVWKALTGNEVGQPETIWMYIV